MSDTLKLPFQLERPSASTPATTAKDVDIDAINGVNATTVQKALEVLAAREGGEGNDTEYEYVSLGSNNGGEEVTFTLTEDTAIYISCSADNPNGQWSLRNSQNETIKSNVALTAGEKYYCGILSAGTYTADHNPTDTLTVYKKVKKQPTASEVTINPITGVNATNVQGALEKLKASITNSGSGSGLEHTSTDSSYSVVVLDPTKTFASQITAENTVYIIQDEFDLDGQIVWMKNNTTLWFYGGMLKNGCLKNAKEGKGGWSLFMTTIMTSFHKLCFSNVVLKGWWRGSGYDWMFEDTVRTEDDYLILNNVCQFEFAHIERKEINIKTWYNPYVEQYDLLFDNSATKKNVSARSIQCYAGLNLDGHGCTINILMNDDEKLAQCASISRGEDTVDEDGNVVIGQLWGVGLTSTFIRCDHKWKDRDDVLNGFKLRNINIIDDNSINEKGADPTVFELQAYDAKHDIWVTAKLHSNFMYGGSHREVIFENVFYRGRCQVGCFGGNYDPADTSLPNMYVTNCDMYVWNDMVFENFSGQYYRAFKAIYYTDCNLRCTSHTNSNSTTKEKEVYTNCVLEGTSVNESDEISYIFNNCVFKGGCVPVSGSGQKVNCVEVNNCILECYNINPLTAGAGSRFRYVGSVGTTKFTSCKFVADYNSDTDYRAILKFGDNTRGTNNNLTFIDCEIQIPDAESFTLDGERYIKGNFTMDNCKITAKNVNTKFVRTENAWINVTEDSDIEALKRNPTKIDSANKNQIYGVFALGWNYLTPPTNAVIVNDMVCSCENKVITMCNPDLTFQKNIFSVTMLVDIPAKYDAAGNSTHNMIFTFNIGKYTFSIKCPPTNDNISISVVDTTAETAAQILYINVPTETGLHNYTFSFDGSDMPMVFIDDKQKKQKTYTGKENYVNMKFDGNTLTAPTLYVGQCCGVKQIIVKPFATR